MVERHAEITCSSVAGRTAGVQALELPAGRCDIPIWLSGLNNATLTGSSPSSGYSRALFAEGAGNHTGLLLSGRCGVLFELLEIDLATGRVSDGRLLEDLTEGLAA